MKLTDMKLTKDEKKNTAPMPSSEYDGPDYPYGLHLELNDDALEKLDMDMPKVGSYVTVTARARVAGVRSSEHSRGSEQHKDRSVELQIEQLAIEPAPRSMKDAVDEGIASADEEE